MLPLQGVPVRSLDGELRCHMLSGMAKKEKRKFISRELFIFSCKALTIKTFKGYSEIGPKSAAVRKENLESKNRSAITTRACDYLKKICYPRFEFLSVLYQ